MHVSPPRHRGATSTSVWPERSLGLGAVREEPGHLGPGRRHPLRSAEPAGPQR